QSTASLLTHRLYKAAQKLCPILNIHQYADQISLAPCILIMLPVQRTVPLTIVVNSIIIYVELLLHIDMYKTVLCGHMLRYVLCCEASVWCSVLCWRQVATRLVLRALTTRIASGALLAIHRVGHSALGKNFTQFCLESKPFGLRSNYFNCLLLVTV